MVAFGDDGVVSPVRTSGAEVDGDGEVFLNVQFVIVGDGGVARGEAVFFVEFACDFDFVAAGLIELALGGFGFAEALIDPVPDAAALEEALFFKEHPVVPEVAGGVAHGVGVFALDEGTLFCERLLFFRACIFFTLFERGIHGSVEVDVGLLLGALVVDGVFDGGAFADPLGAGFEADAVSGFVPEGPHDDGSVVLEGVDHVGDAIEVGGGPGGVFGEGFFAVTHAVGFDVGFADDVEAVFVAELVEAWIVRVVGGADGVDVELLHELDVLSHGGFCDVVAGVGVVVVAVDAFNHDGLAVDEELAVFDLGGFEADFLGVVVGGLITFRADWDKESVENRIFCGPRSDV